MSVKQGGYVSLREKLKRLYYSSPQLIYWLTEVKLHREYQRLRDQVQSELGVHNRVDTVSKLRQKYRQSIHKTCHVIGSGMSVLSSISSIDCVNDFVVGFNYAGLLPIKFDVYFTEVATNVGDYAEASVLHELLYFKMCDNNGPDIYLKRLWDSNSWSPEYALSKYSGELRFILDIAPEFPLLANSRVLNLSRQRLLRQFRANYFINGPSSAVLSALFAYQLGFRNIVVHGVDFIGPHFFHSNMVKGDKSFTDKIRDNCPQVPDDFVHYTGKWMSLEWPHVIRALAQSGVTVYAGSQSSLFSSYAPVYVPYVHKMTTPRKCVQLS
jgi:hypothetical protein